MATSSIVLVSRKDSTSFWIKDLVTRLELKGHSLHLILADNCDSALRSLSQVVADTKMSPAQLLPLVLLDFEAFTDESIKIVQRFGVAGIAFERILVVFTRAESEDRLVLARLGIQEFCIGLQYNPDLLELNVEASLKKATHGQSIHGRFDLRALAKHSHDAIIVFRGPRVLFVNTRFRQLFRLADDSEAITRWDPSLRFEPQDAWQQLLRRGEVATILKPAESSNGFMGVRNDGQSFPCEVLLFALQEGRDVNVAIIRDRGQYHRLEEELLRKNSELRALLELESAIHQSHRLEDILKRACEHVHFIAQAKATGIYIARDGTKSLDLIATEGVPRNLARPLQSLTIRGASLLASAYRKNEIYVVDDMKVDPRITIQAVRDEGFKGAIILPLRSQNRSVGAAFVFLPSGRKVRQRDLQMIKGISVAVGNAIDKAHLILSQENALKRMKALSDITLTLSDSNDSVEVGRRVVESIRKTFSPAFVRLYEYQNEEKAFLELQVHNPKASGNIQRINESDTLLGSAHDLGRSIQRLKPNVMEQGSSRLPRNALRLFNAGVGALVAVPIFYENRLRGGLLLGFPESTPVAQNVIDALETIAMHVAISKHKIDLLDAREQTMNVLRDTQNELVKAERVRAVGEVASGVTHDFNNILTAIKGRTELILGRIEPNAHGNQKILKSELHKILRAVKDGADIAERIRGLAKGERSVEYVRVPANELLRDCVDYVTPDLEQSQKVELITDFESCEGHIYCRPAEIREVVTNLLRNALDAVLDPRNPHTPKVRLRAREAAGLIVIEVFDSGIGVPNDLRESIFEPFVSTKGDAGTGLGLSVSVRITQDHQGALRFFDPEEDDYQTGFRLSLPLAEEPEAEFDKDEVSVVTMLGAQPSNVEGLSILVIDDEESIREILDDVLSDAGYHVVLAECGQDGLMLADQEDFDLILCDLSLPDIPGQSVLQQLQGKDLNQKLGIVTGWRKHDPETQKLYEAVNLVIEKPFHIVDLLSKISELFKES